MRVYFAAVMSSLQTPYIETQASSEQGSKYPVTYKFLGTNWPTSHRVRRTKPFTIPQKLRKVVLVYMSTADLGGKRIRHHSSSHHSQLRSRHHASHSGFSLAGSGYQMSSSLALARMQSGHEQAPFTVADFDMFVEIAKRRFHNFTQLTSNSRLGDLNVTDTTSWHKQYPEFNFHRTDEFKNHQVLVCDASIKIMTLERTTGCDLNINFDLRSQLDLSIFDSLECRTRFFENGKAADQTVEQDKKVKETRTQADYYVEHGGLVRVRFGAKTWAHKMQKLGHILRKASEEEPGSRAKFEQSVRRELQCMTAAQTIYGIKDGESKCLLTILWRFDQTRNNHEAGRVMWRVVNFGHNMQAAWIKEEEFEEIHKSKSLVSIANSSVGTASIPSSAASLYPSLLMEFHQPFDQNPPPLDLDTLALESMASDFSNPNSATTSSLETEYNRTQSLSLAHSQDLGLTRVHEFDDRHDLDFNGGHISISGCLEPAINLSAYEVCDQQSYAQTLASLQTIGDLDATDMQHNDAFDDIALGVGMSNCYTTRPSWHHPGLISHLESAAEQYSAMMVQADARHVDSMGVGNDVNIVGHGVLHDGQMSGELWKLQSAFGDDTGVGAALGDSRKDSVADGGMSGEAVLEFLEREEREERFGGRF